MSAKRESGLGLKGLTKYFGGTRVVDGVNLTVDPGEIVCLLGPSGCGKTTVLRMIAGLTTPDDGEIRLGGRLLAGEGVHVPAEKRKVGLVMQDYALFPHLTVMDNVLFGLRKGTGQGRKLTAREHLTGVGLESRRDAFPHELSGGEQQRVALARALAPNPEVMLLDEPFSGLDKLTRIEVRERTRQILAGGSVPTLMVTHDPEEALMMGDRIAIMRKGCILQFGPAPDILSDPVDPFVMALFGGINRLPGKVEEGRISTPFGPVEAPGLNDGVPAEARFRASDLAVCEEGEGKPAIITARRRLDDRDWLQVCLDGHEDMPLVMSVPHGRLVGDEKTLHIRLETGRVKIFPLSR